MKYGLSDTAVSLMNGVFSQYPHIEKVIIYGSRSKGNYKEGSDIDLTIMGAVSHLTLLEIENKLDDLLLPWMIDLSLYTEIDNQSLKEHIERAGKVFYEHK